MHTTNKFSTAIAGLFIASAVLFSCNESKTETHTAEPEHKTAQADTVKPAEKKTDKPKAEKAKKSDKKVTDNTQKRS